MKRLALAALPLLALAAPAWDANAHKAIGVIAYQGIKPGEAPSEAYEARLIATSERRVALAGYRLVAMLHRLAAERG